jgi:5'(3')-deoxyribonucleotidase
MVRNKKILVIDIDGVACAHAIALCKAINKEFRINSKYDDIKHYNYDFGPLKFKQAVNKYYRNKIFIENMPATKGFKSFLKHISKIMDVSFASARKEYSKKSTRLWIKNNFGKGFRIYFNKDKSKLKYDYLIDDYEKEIIRSARLKRLSFLISRPWNNHLKTKRALKKFPKAIFVYNFTDILKYLQKIR